MAERAVQRIVHYEPTALELATARGVLAYYAANGDPIALEYLSGAMAYLDEYKSDHPGQLPLKTSRFPVWRAFDRLLGITVRRQQFEATHTLGVEPSIISSPGWLVHHPAWDPEVVYEEILGRRQLIHLGNFLSLLADGENTVGTGIEVNLYGGRRLQLRIQERGEYGWKTLEWYILRNEPTEEIDSKLVVFRFDAREVKHFLKLRLSGEGNVVELSQYKPVQKSQSQLQAQAG